MCYISAENFELLGNLLTQLSWLLSNVVYGDANGLLAHYKDNKRKVPQNVRISKRNVYNCPKRINISHMVWSVQSNYILMSRLKCRCTCLVTGMPNVYSVHSDSLMCHII